MKQNYKTGFGNTSIFGLIVLALALAVLTESRHRAVAAESTVDFSKTLTTEAAVFAKQINDEADRNMAFAEIGLSQAISGDFAGAEKTAEIITDAHRKDLLRGAIAVERINSGDIRGGIGMVNKDTSEGVQFRIISAVSKAEARKGNFTQAKALTAKITEPFWKAQADADIALAQAKSGDWGGALKTADSIIDASSVKTEAYINIAQAQSDAGNKTEAIRIITLAKASMKDDLKFALPSTFGELAASQIKAGDPSLGTTLATIAKLESNSYAYLIIARTQLEMGELSAAHATAAKISDDNKLDFNLALYESQMKKRDAEAATKSLAAAKAAALALTEHEARCFAARRVASAQAKAGDSQGAAAWARTLNDAHARVSALGGVIKGVADARQLP